MDATTDHWFQVAAWLERAPNDTLLKMGKQMSDGIERENQAKQRHQLTHLPGWSGACAAPTLGLIKITLLIRGLDVPHWPGAYLGPKPKSGPQLALF
jgi:hypothetical protein